MPIYDDVSQILQDKLVERLREQIKQLVTIKLDTGGFDPVRVGFNINPSIFQWHKDKVMLVKLVNIRVDFEDDVAVLTKFRDDMKLGFFIN